MTNKWIDYVKQYRKHHGIKLWRDALVAAKDSYWTAKQMAVRSGVTTHVPFIPQRPAVVEPVADAFNPNTTTTHVKQLPEPVTEVTAKKQFVSRIPKPKTYNYRRRVSTHVEDKPSIVYDRMRQLMRHRRTHKINPP